MPSLRRLLLAPMRLLLRALLLPVTLFVGPSNSSDDVIWHAKRDLMLR